MADIGFVLEVVFYRSEAGNEPVREWLKDLNRDDKRQIGEDIKTAQLGWPLEMPLIRKIDKDLWEVRTRLADGIARVFFTVDDEYMILLHGFIKKSQKTPQNELKTALSRLESPWHLQKRFKMKNKHSGSSFDDFLEEEGLRAEAEAAAIKRVITFQIEQEMKQANLSKTAMAEKMRTSRTALDRLLDPANVSVTLQTLERAALALGKSLKIELT